MNKLLLLFIVIVAVGAYFHFSAPDENLQATQKSLPTPENPEPGSFAAMKKQAEDMARQANQRQQEEMRKMEAVENQ